MFLYIKDPVTKETRRITVDLHEFKEEPEKNFLELETPYYDPDPFRINFEAIFKKNTRNYTEGYNNTATYKFYEIRKKRQILAVIERLLEWSDPAAEIHADQIETKKFLEAKRNELVIAISKENNSDVAPAKQNKVFRPDVPTEEIAGNHSHTAKRVKKQGKNGEKSYVVIEEGHDSFRPEFRAFASQLIKYAVGAEHTPKVSCAVDENGLRKGVQAREIKDLQKLHELAKEGKLPTQDELIKAGLIEVLVAAYVFAENDLHPNNIGLDENGKIIWFDLDRLLYILTCIYCDYKPNQPLEWHGNKYPSALESFPITAKDLLSFPILNDAKPFWWLLSQNKGQSNILLPFLHGIEKNPEVQYRTFKAFLRITLMERSMGEEFAKAHIRKTKKQSRYVDFTMERINKIKDTLFTLGEFKNFLRLNPQVFSEIIADLKSYNASIKEKDAAFRINIDDVQEKLITLAEPNLLTKFKALKNSHEKLTSGLDTIKDKEFIRFSPVSLSNEISQIEADLKQWPEENKSLSTIAEQIQQLDGQINGYNTKVSHTIFIEKISSLHEKIYKIKQFYNRVNNKEINAKINAIYDQIDFIYDRIGSSAFISNPEKMSINTQLEKIEGNIESFFKLTKNRNLAMPSVSGLPKNISASEALVAGINEVFKLTPTKLKSQYPGQFFIKVQHDWHVTEAKNKYLVLELQLSQENPENGTSSALKLAIVRAVIEYFNQSPKSITTQRIIDSYKIMDIIKEVGETNVLKDKISSQLEKIHTGFFSRSKMREHVKNALDTFDKNFVPHIAPAA